MTHSLWLRQSLCAQKTLIWSTQTRGPRHHYIAFRWTFGFAENTKRSYKLRPWKVETGSKCVRSLKCERWACLFVQNSLVLHKPFCNHVSHHIRKHKWATLYNAFANSLQVFVRIEDTGRLVKPELCLALCDGFHIIERYISTQPPFICGVKAEPFPPNNLFVQSACRENHSQTFYSGDYSVNVGNISFCHSFTMTWCITKLIPVGLKGNSNFLELGS